MLRTPEEYPDHLKYYSGGLIMQLTYGIRTKRKDDPYLELSERVAVAINEASIPGSFLVDIFPWMKYIPEWVPGATFKRKARLWRQAAEELLEFPYKTVKRAIANDTAEECYVKSSLEDIALSKGKVEEADEDVIKHTAGVIYGAGVDSTSNTLKIFLLAMALFPEVQRKGQQELDAALSGSRLPEFEDRGNLPYILAIVKETLRWHPILPLGLPRSAAEDDIIEGHFIPKGTIVFGNAWQLLHDEDEYGPNTDKFVPERFLRPGVRDPAATAAFGYGRRICPGRFVAENSLFMVIASILQVFDVLPPQDSSGKDLPVDYAFGSGFFSFANDFKCIIRPRSKGAEQLINV
ncbi:hypothetical protein M422DRAFT_205484 [Sphaerobolus stellatus SS14]|nr:hypothetical protein M422DRAFT_205484 [Sphaerobolus stellatus SS14]